MIAKSLVIVIMAFLGALGLAEAQETQTEQSPEPVYITPSVHRALTRDGTVRSGASVSLSAGVGTEAIPQVATGWNYAHV